MNSPILTRALRLFLSLALAALTYQTQGAVSAGGMAIVGFDDGSGSFTVAALENIAVGETVYFTNNGWSTSQGQFNGADPTQGAGNESLIKLTATAAIAKGTMISSTTNGSSWSWTNTGLIPGQDYNYFSDLTLGNESDQIYIFQASDSNPLLNPTNFIYALHNGSADYPDFSDLDPTLTGEIAPGLSVLAHTAFAQTNFTFHGTGDVTSNGDPMPAPFGLNMEAPAIAFLQAHGGHKEDWLAAIGNSSNWGAGQPSMNLLVMPEPGRAFLIVGGGLGLAFRRRRPLVKHS